MAAARGGHLDCARLLLESNGDIEKEDAEGWTALHYAATSGNDSLMKYLLDRKPIMSTRLSRRGQSPISIALNSGNVDTALILLDKDASSIHRSDSAGLTPIHIATVSGQTSIIEKLVSLGAGLNPQSHDGQTPLHVAIRLCHCKKRQVEVTTSLKQIQLESDDRISPAEALIQLLINQGSKIDIKDNDGFTPVQYARDERIRQRVFRSLFEDDVHKFRELPIARFTEIHRSIGCEGGILNLDSCDVTMSIPPGTVQAGTCHDVSLALVTDDPPSIREREFLTGHGIEITFPAQWRYSQNQPITLSLPHAATFLKSKDVHADIIWKQSESTSVNRDDSFEGSDTQCIIKEREINLVIDANSVIKDNVQLWIPFKIHQAFGKRMACTPFLPIDMAQGEAIILRMYIHEDIPSVVQEIQEQEKNLLYRRVHPGRLFALEPESSDLELECNGEKKMISAKALFNGQKILVSMPITTESNERTHMINLSVSTSTNQPKTSMVFMAIRTGFSTDVHSTLDEMVARISIEFSNAEDIQNEEFITKQMNTDQYYNLGIALGLSYHALDSIQFRSRQHKKAGLIAEEGEVTPNQRAAIVMIRYWRGLQRSVSLVDSHLREVWRSVNDSGISNRFMEQETRAGLVDMVEELPREGSRTVLQVRDSESKVPGRRELSENICPRTLTRTPSLGSDTSCSTALEEEDPFPVYENQSLTVVKGVVGNSLQEELRAAPQLQGWGHKIPGERVYLTETVIRIKRQRQKSTRTLSVRSDSSSTVTRLEDDENQVQSLDEAMGHRTTRRITQRAFLTTRPIARNFSTALEEEDPFPANEENQTKTVVEGVVENSLQEEFWAAPLLQGWGPKIPGERGQMTETALRKKRQPQKPTKTLSVRSDDSSSTRPWKLVDRDNPDFHQVDLLTGESVLQEHTYTSQLNEPYYSKQGVTDWMESSKFKGAPKHLLQSTFTTKQGTSETSLGKTVSASPRPSSSKPVTVPPKDSSAAASEISTSRARFLSIDGQHEDKDKYHSEGIFDETGGELHIPSYGLTLSIPPGALPKGSGETITLDVLTDIPPEITLRHDETLVTYGFQCLPSGLQFVSEKPVRLKMPHCANLIDPTKVQVVLYSMNNEGKGDRIVQTSRTCIVTYNHVEILLEHFSKGFFAFIKGLFSMKDKRMSFMPFLPKNMTQCKKLMLQFRMVNKPHGNSWKDVHVIGDQAEYQPVKDDDDEMNVKDDDMKVTCQLNDHDIITENVDASFIRKTKHTVYFDLDVNGKADDLLVKLKVIQSMLPMDIKFRKKILAHRDASAESGEARPTEKSRVQDFDDFLKTVAKQIHKEIDIDNLGVKLGFEPPEIKRYINTNEKNQTVTFMGTLSMLRDWRDKTTRSEERQQLKKALIAIDHHHLADDLLNDDMATQPASVNQGLQSNANIDLDAANSSRLTGNIIKGGQTYIGYSSHDSKDDSLGGRSRKKTNRRTGSTDEDERTRGETCGLIMSCVILCIACYVYFYF